MLALVIDTSSAAVTAAIVDVDEHTRPLAQHVVINPRGHGELLAPSIAACLDEAGVQPAELTAVVAGLGPGPFTGLRVGLVTAAVFAATLDIPSYGVCSLDAIGAACDDESGLVVITQARRTEVYWARYRHGARTDGPDVAMPTDVPLDGATALAGAASAMLDTALPVRDARYPASEHVAALAADRVQSRASSELLVPMYLRRPDAVANLTVKPVSR